MLAPLETMDGDMPAEDGDIDSPLDADLKNSYSLGEEDALHGVDKYSQSHSSVQTMHENE